MSACFDLIFAELKGAIVDVLSNTAGNNKNGIVLICLYLFCVISDDGIPVVNNSDITPILATLIVHSKPLHLISNMYYIENFCLKSDCECILAFKTAIDKLKVISIDILKPRSSRIYCDIDIKDIFEITSNVDSRFDKNGRRISHPKNPLERHIENFTNNIAQATLSTI